MIYGRKAQVFVESEDQIHSEIELNASVNPGPKSLCYLGLNGAMSRFILGAECAAP